jgi:hypothetical protein
MSQCDCKKIRGIPVADPRRVYDKFVLESSSGQQTISAFQGNKINFRQVILYQVPISSTSSREEQLSDG